MKKLEKLETINYIQFDNGVEIRYNDLIKELNDMINSNFTLFDKRNEKDMAIFELIKSKCSGGEIDSEDCIGDKIRIVWEDNENLINSLIDEIYDLI